MSPDEQSRQNAIIAFAVEHFRFQKVVSDMLEKMNWTDRKVYSGRSAYFLKKSADLIEAAGLRVVDYVGESYSPGLPVTPLNIEDFPGDDELIVEQTIEPGIFQGDHCLRPGTVMVRRKA